MKVLLDENFPLGLVRVLQSDGFHVEHIITLGWRGVSDDRIREQLHDKYLVFLTQDDDFLSSEPVAAIVVVSRLRQARSLSDRIEVWRSALQSLIQVNEPERVFELTDAGRLVPWKPSDRE